MYLKLSRIKRARERAGGRRLDVSEVSTDDLDMSEVDSSSKVKISGGKVESIMEYGRFFFLLFFMVEEYCRICLTSYLIFIN